MHRILSRLRIKPSLHPVGAFTCTFILRFGDQLISAKAANAVIKKLLIQNIKLNRLTIPLENYYILVNRLSQKESIEIIFHK